MELRLGHVHLRVRNLRRSTDFYGRVLGLAVTETVGSHYTFLSSSAMHHCVALWQIGQAAPLAGPFSTGLQHIAFEVANEEAFARAYERLAEEGIVASSVDHGISWAMYFSDPDGHGVELYCDRRGAADGRRFWMGRNAAIPAEALAS